MLLDMTEHDRRFRTTDVHLPRAALLMVRGDWEWLCQCFRFRHFQLLLLLAPAPDACSSSLLLLLLASLACLLAGLLACLSLIHI